MSSSMLLVLALAAVGYVWLRTWLRTTKLPPGPSGWPVLGCTLDLIDTTTKPWVRFEEWWKQSNAKVDVICVPTLNQTNIVLMSAKAANELFEKRAHIYSARPSSHYLSDIVRGGIPLVDISDLDRVSAQRKMLHEQLGVKSAAQWQLIQTEEAREMIGMFLQSPRGYLDIFQATMENLVRKTTYSSSATVTSERVWEHKRRSSARTHTPLAPLLDIFPILRLMPSWLPGGSYKITGKAYFEEDRRIWEGLRDDIALDLASGTLRPSYMSQLIHTQAPERHGISQLDLAFIAGNLLTAGGDLPEITLEIFVLAMVHHPMVARKIQEELDSVVGRDRMPTFADEAKLPYTRAAILEVQRWRTLVPISLARRVLEDDVYQGYTIPKNAIVWPNLLAMSQDESVYPDAKNFKPERFLTSAGDFTRKDELATFGWGKRLCPAVHVARNVVFINVVSLMWAFDLVPDSTPDGIPILPSADMRDWRGVLPCRPQPFALEAVPRSNVEAAMRARREELVFSHDG
ncbi:uncharacterized protein L969DRAFT_97149 [Mixia osmundae IAM 14324]|uniref:Cytochrome P450 n=1 Tax=Mixia osmundae (strain CBS 9802 / IAM 14324 / JCM 22182 / KY 12970) TaxID=764103 RepID=G7E1U7_MIXOS|nr:uncharacterized protein L969DRAFT_97149 [Mixia osmundae IAM 14324]KEI36753.1 hypothetical protein L969DRAFT_97149 [Mixia osmundae IAM 14324]GAA96807.1 hypothetical protein E5Q_03479 [Mixia osmundae IAM 14324]